jgi:hypothetical protein
MTRMSYPQVETLTDRPHESAREYAAARCRRGERWYPPQGRVRHTNQKIAAELFLSTATSPPPLP